MTPHRKDKLATIALLAVIGIIVALLIFAMCCVFLTGCTIVRVNGPVLWAPRAHQVTSTVYSDDYEGQLGKTVAPTTSASGLP